MKLLPTQSVCAAHQMNWPTICRAAARNRRQLGGYATA